MRSNDSLTRKVLLNERSKSMSQAHSRACFEDYILCCLTWRDVERSGWVSTLWACAVSGKSDQ